MATSSCFSLLNSLTVIQKPGDDSRCSCGMNSSHQKPQRTVEFRAVKAMATKDDQGTVRRSVICSDCDGNGAVLCSQCKGSGVNHVDYFGGQFKAGESCWLCGGKKDMLCGNCNGAGFLGGFMNSFDT